MANPAQPKKKRRRRPNNDDNLPPKLQTVAHASAAAFSREHYKRRLEEERAEMAALQQASAEEKAAVNKGGLGTSTGQQPKLVVSTPELQSLLKTLAILTCQGHSCAQCQERNEADELTNKFNANNKQLYDPRGGGGGGGAMEGTESQWSGMGDSQTQSQWSAGATNGVDTEKRQVQQEQREQERERQLRRRLVEQIRNRLPVLLSALQSTSNTNTNISSTDGGNGMTLVKSNQCRHLFCTSCWEAERTNSITSGAKVASCPICFDPLPIDQVSTTEDGSDGNPPIPDFASQKNRRVWGLMMLNLLMRLEDETGEVGESSEQDKMITLGDGTRWRRVGEMAFVREDNNQGSIAALDDDNESPERQRTVKKKRSDRSADDTANIGGGAAPSLLLGGGGGMLVPIKEEPENEAAAQSETLVAVKEESQSQRLPMAADGKDQQESQLHDMEEEASCPLIGKEKNSSALDESAANDGAARDVSKDASDTEAPMGTEGDGAPLAASQIPTVAQQPKTSPSEAPDIAPTTTAVAPSVAAGLNDLLSASSSQCTAPSVGADGRKSSPPSDDTADTLSFKSSTDTVAHQHKIISRNSGGGRMYLGENSQGPDDSRPNTTGAVGRRRRRKKRRAEGAGLSTGRNRRLKKASAAEPQEEEEEEVQQGGSGGGKATKTGTRSLARCDSLSFHSESSMPPEIASVEEDEASAEVETAPSPQKQPTPPPQEQTESGKKRSSGARKPAARAKAAAATTAMITTRHKRTRLPPVSDGERELARKLYGGTIEELKDEIDRRNEGRSEENRLDKFGNIDGLLNTLVRDDARQHDQHDNDNRMVSGSQDGAEADEVGDGGNGTGETSDTEATIGLKATDVGTSSFAPDDDDEMVDDRVNTTGQTSTLETMASFKATDKSTGHFAPEDDDEMELSDSECRMVLPTGRRVEPRAANIDATNPTEETENQANDPADSVTPRAGSKRKHKHIAFETYEEVDDDEIEFYSPGGELQKRRIDHDHKPIAIESLVRVASRTFPGSNKLGGVGKIKACRGSTEANDLVYDVAYVLGGRECDIPCKYVVLDEAFSDGQSRSTPRVRRTRLSGDDAHLDQQPDHPTRSSTRLRRSPRARNTPTKAVRDDDTDQNETEGISRPSPSSRSTTSSTSKMSAKKARQQKEVAVLSAMSKDEVLSMIPVQVKSSFCEIGFARWENLVYPIIQLGPFDVRAGYLRQKWFNMFNSRHKANRSMQRLVCFYGATTPADAFFFYEAGQIIDYEDGIASGYGRVPPDIQKKIDNGSMLSKEEEQIVKGLKQIAEDAKFEPIDRTNWIPTSSEDEKGHDEKEDEGNAMDDDNEAREILTASQESSSQALLAPSPDQGHQNGLSSPAASRLVANEVDDSQTQQPYPHNSTDATPFGTDLRNIAEPRATDRTKQSAPSSPIEMTARNLDSKFVATDQQGAPNDNEKCPSPEVEETQMPQYAQTPEVQRDRSGLLQDGHNGEELHAESPATDHQLSQSQALLEKEAESHGQLKGVGSQEDSEEFHDSLTSEVPSTEAQSQGLLAPASKSHGRTDLDDEEEFHDSEVPASEPQQSQPSPALLEKVSLMPRRFPDSTEQATESQSPALLAKDNESQSRNIGDIDEEFHDSEVPATEPQQSQSPNLLASGNESGRNEDFPLAAVPETEPRGFESQRQPAGELDDTCSEVPGTEGKRNSQQSHESESQVLVFDFCTNGGAGGSAMRTPSPSKRSLPRVVPREGPLSLSQESVQSEHPNFFTAQEQSEPSEQHYLPSPAPEHESPPRDEGSQSQYVEEQSQQFLDSEAQRHLDYLVFGTQTQNATQLSQPMQGHLANPSRERVAAATNKSSLKKAACDRPKGRVEFDMSAKQSTAKKTRPAKHPETPATASTADESTVVVNSEAEQSIHGDDDHNDDDDDDSVPDTEIPATCPFESSEQQVSRDRSNFPLDDRQACVDDKNGFRSDDEGEVEDSVEESEVQGSCAYYHSEPQNVRDRSDLLDDSQVQKNTSEGIDGTGPFLDEEEEEVPSSVPQSSRQSSSTPWMDSEVAHDLFNRGMALATGETPSFRNSREGVSEAARNTHLHSDDEGEDNQAEAGGPEDAVQDKGVTDDAAEERRLRRVTDYHNTKKNTDEASDEELNNDIPAVTSHPSAIKGKDLVADEIVSSSSHYGFPEVGSKIVAGSRTSSGNGKKKKRSRSISSTPKEGAGSTFLSKMKKKHKYQRKGEERHTSTQAFEMYDNDSGTDSGQKSFGSGNREKSSTGTSRLFKRTPARMNSSLTQTSVLDHMSIKE